MSTSFYIESTEHIGAKYVDSDEVLDLIHSGKWKTSEHKLVENGLIRLYAPPRFNLINRKCDIQVVEVIGIQNYISKLKMLNNNVEELQVVDLDETEYSSSYKQNLAKILKVNNELKIVTDKPLHFKIDRSVWFICNKLDFSKIYQCTNNTFPRIAISANYVHLGKIINPLALEEWFARSSIETVEIDNLEIGEPISFCNAFELTKIGNINDIIRLIPGDKISNTSRMFAECSYDFLDFTPWKYIQKLQYNGIGHSTFENSSINCIDIRGVQFEDPVKAANLFLGHCGLLRVGGSNIDKESLKKFCTCIVKD